MANDRAHALASASRSGGGSYLADHWSERAEALLAPLLHAAALGGKTMASVLRWVLRKDVDEAVELTSGTDGHFLAADTIEGVLTTDARERSGIFSTAANLLAAYRNPAALQATIEPNFDPEAFVRSSDTVYICAPAAEQDLLAPIVVAFLESAPPPHLPAAAGVPAGAVRARRGGQHRPAAPAAFPGGRGR